MDMPLGQTPSDDHPCRLRVLIEDLALKTEDLGKSLEGVQGLAEEIALGLNTGLHPEALVRMQVLDSLTQRLFVLPKLLRCLKAAIPEELAMSDLDLLRSFAVTIRSYHGTAISDRPERSDESGDCELWSS